MKNSKKSQVNTDVMHHYVLSILKYLHWSKQRIDASQRSGLNLKEVVKALEGRGDVGSMTLAAELTRQLNTTEVYGSVHQADVDGAIKGT